MCKQQQWKRKGPNSSQTNMSSPKMNGLYAESQLSPNLKKKATKFSVLLLTWDQYEPVDVLIEVVQNFAVHWSRVRWGHEVLLGPLELTMQPCNPVLEQAAGWGYKTSVNMENTSTFSATFWTLTVKVTWNYQLFHYNANYVWNLVKKNKTKDLLIN